MVSVLKVVISPFFLYDVIITLFVLSWSSGIIISVHRSTIPHPRHVVCITFGLMSSRHVINWEEPFTLLTLHTAEEPINPLMEINIRAHSSATVALCPSAPPTHSLLQATMGKAAQTPAI